MKEQEIAVYAAPNDKIYGKPRKTRPYKGLHYEHVEEREVMPLRMASSAVKFTLFRKLLKREKYFQDEYRIILRM